MQKEKEEERNALIFAKLRCYFRKKTPCVSNYIFNLVKESHRAIKYYMYIHK